MIKICETCKLETLLCIRCKEAGAFDKGGENAPIHSGKCIYEPCKYCEQQHKRKFVTTMKNASEQ